MWDTSSASREAVTASMSMFYRQAPCITQEGMDALLKSGFTRGVDPTRKASVVFDKTDRMNKRPTAILAEGLSRTAAMAADAMEYGYVTDKEIQRVVGLGRLYGWKVRRMVRWKVRWKVRQMVRWKVRWMVRWNVRWKERWLLLQLHL